MANKQIIRRFATGYYSYITGFVKGVKGIPVNLNFPHLVFRTEETAFSKTFFTSCVNRVTKAYLTVSVFVVAKIGVIKDTKATSLPNSSNLRPIINAKAIKIPINTSAQKK